MYKVKTKIEAAAHPRSRGEHLVEVGVVEGVTGSSPLARGTLLERRACKVRHRLIPARAGNTGRRLRMSMPTAAHPRSRGEHYKFAGSTGLTFGSSPLARGTPSH